MATFKHVFGIGCRQNCVIRLLQCHRCRFPTRQHHILSSALQQDRNHDYKLSQTRSMSGGERNFFKQLIENMKQDFAKNKELKESLRKFREEREKLEESDAIKKAREKFESIEKEGSTAFQKTFQDVKEKVSETVEEVGKSDFAKKGKELTEELGKTAGKAAETISKSSQQIGQSASFQKVSEGVKAVKEEIDEVTMSRGRTYKPPVQLRKRKEYSTVAREEKTVEADEESTGMVLHKDSKWYQSWQNFKENNQYVNKVFDLKTKYDESDNVVIRATRVFTDKLSSIFGSVFSKTEMSEVMTEICKIDPSFNQEKFTRFCESTIIPNILEALIRGDLEILKDWLHEGPYNTLSHPIKEAHNARYKSHSSILDVSHVDIAGGKMMEQGPVILITFSSQQIEVWKDFKGEVVVGDPEKIVKMSYVWALCRDQEELDPSAAWKLIDISASATEQWL